MDSAEVSRSVVVGYQDAASELIPAYDALPPQAVLAPVAKFLERKHSSVLDIGAGTGRTAHWFASQGSFVTAVEPTPAFSLPRTSTPRASSNHLVR